MTAKPLAALLLVAVALACGKSREQRALEDIESICLALPGQTLRQAANQLSGANTSSQAFVCPSNGGVLVNVGGTCPPQTTDDPQCAFFFEWQAYDPGLCGAQGGCCFLCEVRVTRSSTTAGVDTPICASRWLSRQICQFL